MLFVLFSKEIYEKTHSQENGSASYFYSEVAALSLFVLHL